MCWRERETVPSNPPQPIRGFPGETFPSAQGPHRWGVPSGPGKRTGAPEETEVHVCLVYEEAAKGWGRGEQAMHSAELRIERDACTTAKKPGAGARPPSSAQSTEQWGFQPMDVVGKDNRLVPCGSWGREGPRGQLQRDGLHLAISTDLWTDRVT